LTGVSPIAIGVSFPIDHTATLAWFLLRTIRSVSWALALAKVSGLSQEMVQ
jgi:hypothetical protein